jgi:hypothetical protein
MRFTWFGLVLAAIGVYLLVAGSMLFGIVMLVLAFTVGGLDLVARRRSGEGS